MITTLSDIHTTLSDIPMAQEASVGVCCSAQGNYFYYSRSDNPNYLLLERELTRLHHGRQSPHLFILFN
jgi:hypothetical protein